MDLSQLAAFDRVVREGSFSRAAWALNIAQPTISARIQALEREVGGPLFERNNRRVSLTEKGVSFLPYARQALAAITDGLHASQTVPDGQQGTLRVGALRSFAECLLGPALAAFHGAYPDVECRIHEGRHGPIVGLLADGMVELGLIAWPCLTPPPVAMTPLLHFREEVILAAAAAHPLAQYESITQEDVLAGCELFLLCRWWQMTPDVVHHMAHRARHQIDVPAGIGRYLLTQGTGVGFFPRTLLAAELEAGRVRRLAVADLSPLYRDSALVHLARTNTLSQVAANFTAALQQQAQSLQLL